MRRAPVGEPRPHIVLIGMMGAGKSSVGVLVADALGWPAIDLDAVIEGAEGRSVATIFAEDGEPAFRALERSAAAAALGADEPAVVSLGGGAVVDEATRSLAARRGHVVWLRASPQVLAGRVAGGAGRPLLADASADPAAVLERLVVARAEAYASVADQVVDVDELDAAQVAGLIVAGVPS